MEPNVTLHWFVHPAWFEHIGAFLKEKNIPIFVKFAEYAFSEFRAFPCPCVTLSVSFIRPDHINLAVNICKSTCICTECLDQTCTQAAPHRGGCL